MPKTHLQWTFGFMAVLIVCLTTPLAHPSPIRFKDVTEATGIRFQHTDGSSGQRYIVESVSAGLALFDNDGDRDLFIACGHVQDNVENYDNRSTYRQKNIVQVNTGQGSFTPLPPDNDNGLTALQSSRGAGFDDLDQDGDIDVVILNSRSTPTVLRNDTRSAGNWLSVQLQGRASNRDGVGARVTLTAGDLCLVDEVHSGRSYQSHFGSRLHFGVGSRRQVDQIEVRWMGGRTEVYTDIPINQHLDLREGDSEHSTPAAPSR